MLDIFRGQLTYEDICSKMTYKEAVLMKESRIKRLQKRNADMAKQGGPSITDIAEEIEQMQ